MKQLKLLSVAVLVAAFLVPALAYAEVSTVDIPIVLSSQDEKGTWVDWNKGEVHGWVKGVNLEAVSYLQAAQIYLDESEAGKAWAIVNPLVDNIERFSMPFYEVKKDKDGKPEIVTGERMALRLKLEPIYIGVSICHHIQRAGQAELIECTEAPYPRGVQLDASRVPSTWALSKYVDVALDPSKTAVNPVNVFDKTLGQYIFKGWVVDLYYFAHKPQEAVASKPEPSHVDAVRHVPALPATGAVSPALMWLGSFALVLIGLKSRKM